MTGFDPWIPPLDLDRPPPGRREWTWSEQATGASFSASTFWNLLKQVLDHRQFNRHLFKAEELDPDRVFETLLTYWRITLNMPMHTRRPNRINQRCLFCP